ncbi:aminodeoxychorismate/anthranilate synthase component II [Desulforhopalus sp. IMCC35007]|nr:aminodeoxychorismate/anthranilate synthase component II [Desulforhopalus sp. IMCC35007]
MTAKLLVIDNYDSFTYNLVQMFRQYPLEIQVHRSDQIDVAGVAHSSPDYILISPGPKAPADAGISLPVIATYYKDVPILGVCLGMQCLNEVFGGLTTRAPQPVHGKTSHIFHQGAGVFRDLPSPFRAARYHSLIVQPRPDALLDQLLVTAETKDQIIMGLSHRHYPLHGVQFHPESFLTDHSFQLIENFLRLGSMEKI